MNGPLLRYTFRSNIVRLVVIAAGLVLMGVIMPVMYAAFGREMTDFIEATPFFSQLLQNFGGGDALSLTGSMSMAFTHPFTLLLMGIMAIAFPALAIAGEREKGLALIAKAADDGYFIRPNEAYLQTLYDNPGFAPILASQEARQARERNRFLAIVCTGNPYSAVWQPAEGTCERFAAEGGD